MSNEITGPDPTDMTTSALVREVIVHQMLESYVMSGGRNTHKYYHERRKAVDAELDARISSMKEARDGT